jgi:hypothetical protein
MFMFQMGLEPTIPVLEKRSKSVLTLGSMAGAIVYYDIKM